MKCDKPDCKGVAAKILFVDDDDSVRKMAKTYLEEHCKIVLAGSAQEGLELLGSHGPFDFVVSDLNMPGINGMEFLRQVAYSWPETIRILISGGAVDMDKVMQAFTEGHFSKYLSKPFFMDPLISLLMEKRNCSPEGMK